MKTSVIQFLEPGDLVGIEAGGLLTLWRVSSEGVLVSANDPESLPQQDLPVPQARVLPDYRSLAAGVSLDEQGIEVMDLSVRAYNVLKREGIHTIGALRGFHQAEGHAGLRGLRNIGEKAAVEIEGHLDAIERCFS